MVNGVETLLSAFLVSLFMKNIDHYYLLSPAVVDVPDCGVLLPPVNGSVLLENITIGSVANYSCDQGFELLGVSSRTCQGDSTWSDRPPTCVGMC